MLVIEKADDVVRKGKKGLSGGDAAYLIDLEDMKTKLDEVLANIVKHTTTAVGGLVLRWVKGSDGASVLRAVVTQRKPNLFAQSKVTIETLSAGAAWALQRLKELTSTIRVIERQIEVVSRAAITAAQRVTSKTNINNVSSGPCGPNDSTSPEMFSRSLSITPMSSSNGLLVSPSQSPSMGSRSPSPDVNDLTISPGTCARSISTSMNNLNMSPSIYDRTLSSSIRNSVSRSPNSSKNSRTRRRSSNTHSSPNSPKRPRNMSTLSPPRVSSCHTSANNSTNNSPSSRGRVRSHSTFHDNGSHSKSPHRTNRNHELSLSPSGPHRSHSPDAKGHRRSPHRRSLSHGHSPPQRQDSNSEEGLRLVDYGTDDDDL